jgi:hypothetical protein
MPLQCRTLFIIYIYLLFTFIYYLHLFIIYIYLLFTFIYYLQIFLPKFIFLVTTPFTGVLEFF